jgi:hypothetical protein
VMSTLVRGFKTWAERTAASLRRELDLEPIAPISPARLAAFLDVQLWTPRDIPGLSQTSLDQLLIHDPSGWSAVACAINGDDVVIYNPKHSSGRQASDVAHELAHIILGHEPGKIVLSQDGSMVMRSFDRQQEEEANCLGWTILLPREALAAAIRARQSTQDIATRYGVSEQLVQYRRGITGVDIVAARTRRRRSA